ncbi:MAG: sensor histidine kinase [Pseudomonadota bacterium]
MTERVSLHRRLTTRVLFFLTLALVPLGLIGVMLNLRLSAEVQQRQDLSLLALTERAASGERQIVQRAFGAAQSLGGIATEFLDNTVECREYLRRFKASEANFAFAGFIGTDGISSCSTVDGVLDFSGYPAFADLIANPRMNVEVNLNAPGSGQSVMIINQPHYDESVFLGYISVSLPLRDVGDTFDFLGEANPEALVTVNAAGQLLSTEQGRDKALQHLPADVALDTLAQGEARTMIARSASGRNLVYTIVPIVPDVIYALGAWERDSFIDARSASPVVSTVLPFLMWLASLLVVWLVIDRLVIQRIQALNGQMRRFAQDRTLPSDFRGRNAPEELLELETALQRMAYDIVQDEAGKEDQLREKSVLLKEVHHRVKNNLQIISSIMNMQIRKAKAPETKLALGQVQDRIMGLSGVHRTLYQADNLTEVNAAALIQQIIEQSRAVGATDGKAVAVETSLEPMVVFPDQAVPLSMYVSEALTNAMKYIGGEAPRVFISLKLESENEAHLIIENTKSANPGAAEETSSGLGQQLMQAFATQLNGKTEATETDTDYRLSLNFHVEDFKEDPVEY